MSMKAILIDSDSHALYILEKQLTRLSDIEVIGSYHDPYLGKEAILGKEIDVLFLETVLPRLSGVILAKQLKDIQPHLNIVFLTSHKEYALDAYNLNALDYIVKPLRKDRLEKTIKRLEYKYLIN